MPGRPTDADWASLSQAVGGRLSPVRLPDLDDPTVHRLLRLAGASAGAIEAVRDTAMNPNVLDAFALAIITMPGPSAFPGFPAPDLVVAVALRSRVQAAMAALRVAAPGTGVYVNECDYFQTDWQNAFGARTTHGLPVSSVNTTRTVSLSFITASAAKPIPATMTDDRSLNESG